MIDIRFISWAGYQLAPCSGGLAEDASLIIWNGIGPHDGGGDWSRTGFGIETALAKHSGSYGLDVTGMVKSSTFAFYASTGREVPVDEWDFLRVWVNVRDWQNHDKEVFVRLYYGSTYAWVALNQYLSITQLGGWQKAMIPLIDFNFVGYDEIEVSKLEFVSDGHIGLFVDDLAFVAGTQETRTVAVCAPDMTADGVGTPKITGQEIKPGLRGFPQPNMTITDPNADPYPKRYL